MTSPEITSPDSVTPVGFCFKVLTQDTNSAARRSVLTTPHGCVQLPTFMPVGTQATVKGLAIDQVQATGAEMLLANTYHLSLRPGEDIVNQLGGLHAMMQWDGPILTDSGGFQLFSLAKMCQVTEQGAIFKSHIDGSTLELTPEKSILIQETLGSDIAMVLDHLVALPNEKSVIRAACERSIRWAQRCQIAARSAQQIQFAIVQGGLDESLRVWCAEELANLDFFGYAVGGLSVGEPPAEMYRILDATCPALPVERPRYLMGVGRPQDLLEGIRRGIDMFDCVMPTRNGRNAMAFTDQGPIKLRNAKYRTDKSPIETGCPCLGCRHSRGYIRHLFQSGEMLGPILLTHHNLTYYRRLMTAARTAIEADDYEAFYQKKMAAWG
ncbi:MAG: tRNA guanosine(34) transglycosylase Tgt [Planctomycetaceae bacterium]|jgi:queuine tRNA-ribosyltransferase|nr:tRNA guanosine(34) transglycosylase Tgt [Planctomycetaceae bacterium]